MKKEDVINTGKNMVVEYFNKYIDKTNGKKRITVNDVAIIGICDEVYIYRILYIIPRWYGIYFGVTYDSTKEKLYSYVYKKVGKRFYGKRERKNNERSI